MQYKPQSEQEIHNEQLENMVLKPKPLPASYGNLPPAPTRSQFSNQDEFEEALGYWQGHVGRIKGMVARAQASTESSKNSDPPKY